MQTHRNPEKKSEATRRAAAANATHECSGERGTGEHGSGGDERDSITQGLELEAAPAAEKAWELQEAWASFSVSPELEQDLPLRGTDIDGNTRASDSPSAPNPSALDKVSLQQAMSTRDASRQRRDARCCATALTEGAECGRWRQRRRALVGGDFGS